MNSTTIPASSHTFDSAFANAHASVAARIHSVDIVRGFVIVLMALDHVRDFFSNAKIDLLDPSETTVGLYLTRWITHLCAPTFIFLAGVSAQRMSLRVSTGELSRFLLTRGLWLIALEVTVVLAAWSFNVRYQFGVFLQVIWAIGASMVCLAALAHLKRLTIGAFAVLVILGHNLLDGIAPAAFGGFAPLWTLLHVQGPFSLGFVSYPLIPWVAVMALGFVMGAMYDMPVERRRSLLRRAGIIAITAFVVLRISNAYGDPNPWVAHGDITATLMSFFDVEKYPPSLLYLLATLGLCWLCLAAAESFGSRLASGFASVLEVFGRVPLFVYVMHIVVAHLLAGLIAWSMGYGTTVLTNVFMFFPKEWGFGLPVVYTAWLAVLALLYPLCRWFGELKRRRSDWWLAYL